MGRQAETEGEDKEQEKQGWDLAEGRQGQWENETGLKERREKMKKRGEESQRHEADSVRGGWGEASRQTRRQTGQVDIG